MTPFPPTFPLLVGGFAHLGLLPPRWATYLRRWCSDFGGSFLGTGTQNAKNQLLMIAAISHFIVTSLVVAIFFLDHCPVVSTKLASG